MMRKHLFTRGNVTGGKVRDATSTEWGVWLCGWRPLACVEDSQQGVLSRRGEAERRGQRRSAASPWPGPKGGRRHWCGPDYPVNRCPVGPTSSFRVTHSCLQPLLWLLWGWGRSEVNQVARWEQDFTAEHKQSLQHINVNCLLEHMNDLLQHMNSLLHNLALQQHSAQTQ